MARQLTSEEIGELAGRPNVRRIAAENFLMSLDTGMSQADHLRNLEMDARLYKWNQATQAAIRAGLDMAYAEAVGKPEARLIGTDGNIFSLMAVAGKALKKAGQREQYVEMLARVQAEAKSYGQALDIIGQFVEIY